jgi:hypothetical protein
MTPGRAGAHHPLPHQGVLRLRHAPSVRGPMVIVSEQVQEAVRQVAVQLPAQSPPGGTRGPARRVEGDHHVPEETAPGGPAARKREHVGGAVHPAPVAVQAEHGPIVHHEDG